MKNVPITEEAARKLAEAIARLTELGDSKIINPTTEAEVKGLRQFISNTTAEHANELIACWFAVHFEYEPLIHGFAGLLSRANGILARNLAAKQAVATPDNGVP